MPTMYRSLISQPINKTIRLLLVVPILVGIVACGAKPPPPTPSPTPSLSPQEQLGKRVFSRECAQCHSLSEGVVVVGPSLAGIAERAEERMPNSTAEAYLLQSIMRPDAYLVEAFENLMPSNLGKKLTGEEVDGVVAYLLTIHSTDK